MAPYELDGRLLRPAGTRTAPRAAGLAQALPGTLPQLIWLNPSQRPDWGEYWTQTYDAIAEVFPMFPLTVEGLEDGMKKLLVR